MDMHFDRGADARADHDGARPDGGAHDTSGNSAYTAEAHAAHLRRVLAGAAVADHGGAVTADDLLGRAGPDDERLISMTRAFAHQNRILCVRSADIDRALAARRRAKKQAERDAVAAAQAAQRAAAPGGMKDTDTDAYRFVSMHLDDWGLKVNARGQTEHPEVNRAGALDALLLLNSQFEKKEQFKDSALKAALDRNIAVRRLDALDALRRSLDATAGLAVAPEAVRTLLADVLRLGLSDDSPFTPEEAALLVEKFIWQVKRKLWGLPVTQHQMLVLVGPQGGGKSVAIKSFLEPVDDVTVNIDLKTLSDERTASVFEEAYVGFADELEKAERACIDGLKRIITETKIERRIMRSNSTATFRQNCTFIAASNKDVAEMIPDETGNRRFVSLPIIGPDDDRSGAFWDAVNALDWRMVWRSVDWRGEDPTAPIRDKIAAAQRAERSQSNIELWVQAKREEPEASIWRGWTSTSDLYDTYRFWEESYAPKAQTSFAWWQKAFARQCRQGTVPFRAVRRNGNGPRGYEATEAPAGAGTEGRGGGWFVAAAAGKTTPGA